MNDKKEYTISEAAGIIGVSASALRYYDREGLLPNVRKVSGKRVFSEADIASLRVLECLKATGMSIRDIREYFDLARQGDATLEERYAIILRQKEIVNRQIAFLNDNLRELNRKEQYYKQILSTAAGSGHEGGRN